MSVLTAVVLGLVQGIAEFLPISSSGHLAIAEHLLSIQGASNVPDFFDVLLHLGTLVAVFAAYWDDIRDMIVEFFTGIGDLAHHRTPNPVPPARRLILLIIVGTLPLFVMVPFRRFFTELSDNMYFIGGALIVTGILLFASDRVRHGRKTEKTATLLDALLVAVFPLGLFGAAAATALSQVVGGFIPLIYFALPNGSALRFTKPRFDGKALLRTVTNGSSELMSNISMSIVSMLYNTRLMEYAGENGVAAYGVLMYVAGIFLAIFIGYSTGAAPVASFSLGAQNNGELRNLFRKSLAVIGCSSLLMFGLGELLSSPLATLFVGYDDGLKALTVHAFKIYSFSFLLSGISVFGSAFFTALGDGLTSALIAFLRSLVFQTAAVMLLPLIFEIDGIWYSIIAAELVSAAVTAVFFAVHRKKYRYF